MNEPRIYFALAELLRRTMLMVDLSKRAAVDPRSLAGKLDFGAEFRVSTSIEDCEYDGDLALPESPIGETNALSERSI